MAIPAPAVAARRAASIIVERLALEPPVDVEALLRQKAEVTRIDWPSENVDAVLTGLAGKPGSTRVFVRATDNLLRERFTIAHELGHIFLPWHLPQPNCEIGEGALDLPTYSVEDEADVFASCILVPDVWLRSLVGRHRDDMSGLLRELNAAEVTTVAALMALRRYLLAGWVFIAYRDSRVIATPGTHLPVGLKPGHAAEVLAALCQASGDASLNGYSVRWFRMAALSPLPVRGSDDQRPDHQMLLDAIASVESDEVKQISIAQSANGKVGGGLKEAAGRPAEETYRAVRYRCEQWEYASLLEQPDFLLWLAERSRAVEAGTTKRRRTKGSG